MKKLNIYVGFDLKTQLSSMPLQITPLVFNNLNQYQEEHLP
jgi:hypothetical protein